MYCSACETIVQELSDEINREVDTKQIETGSFRVGGDGKQRGKKKVPYKRSDLHIETVFDQVCIRMSKLYRKAKAGDFFIKPEPVEEGEENEADEDHASKYQLTSICQGFVDDKPDELLSVFKSPQQLSDYHEQVVGGPSEHVLTTTSLPAKSFEIVLRPWPGSTVRSTSPGAYLFLPQMGQLSHKHATSQAFDEIP
eukprot:CAMPEP_0198730698 /NCGR_PEP_ID=MMETSP1475-20131203/25665_1 /TAXON_ID= ORGANISM="Unidentified sp., Strain CCMP1999" /NCGR_SAMPLE_ID=MMETSP1475 /ASSEMBLY_ACC=CAM_ASM_001111 /LENGTH=196 /DNA_ID=CAMNT_0044493537 /DNA_START=304 /DNA_END=895 /DNA_ORIENTATION=+